MERTRSYDEFLVALGPFDGLREALAIVCAEHSITLEDAYGSERTPRAVRARAACYRRCLLAGLSVLEVADLWNKHKTLIYHAKRRAAS